MEEDNICTSPPHHSDTHTTSHCVLNITSVRTHHSSSSCVFKLHKGDCCVTRRLVLSRRRLSYFLFFPLIHKLRKRFSQASGTILFCPQKSDVNPEFNSEQDSQQNRICEGFPVMSAIKRIENSASVGETGSRERGAGEGEGEKKGNADDGEIEESSWTEGGEGVPHSLLPPPTPHLPPINYHSHTLKK